jgi:hypothetical protein
MSWFSDGPTRANALEQLRLLYAKANASAADDGDGAETVLSALSTAQLRQLFEGIGRCLTDNAAAVDWTLINLLDDLAKAASGQDTTAEAPAVPSATPPVPAVALRTNVAVPGLLNALVVSDAMRKAATAALCTLVRWHYANDVLSLIVRHGFLHEDVRLSTLHCPALPAVT